MATIYSDGFEYGTANDADLGNGWSPYNANCSALHGIAGASAYAGTQVAFSHSFATVSGGTFGIVKTFNFHPGVEYTITARVKRSNTNMTNLRIWAGTTETAIAVPAVNTWALITHTFTASATSHQVEILANRSGTSTEYYNIDAFEITSLVTTVPVAQNSPTTWDVRSKVTDAQLTTYAVRSKISDTQATTWNAAGKIADTQATAWDVRSKVVDTSPSTTYDVRSKALTAGPVTSWAVFTPVSVSQSTTWDVAATVAVEDSVSTSWDVRSKLTDSVSTEWDVRVAVLDSVSTEWAVSLAVSDSISTEWGILATVETQNINTSWDVETPVATRTSNGEGQPNGTVLDTTNSAGSGDAFNNVTGNVFYSTDYAGANGSASAILPSHLTGMHYAAWTDANAGQRSTVRTYLFLDSLPSSTNYMGSFNTLAGTALGIWGVTTSGMVISRVEGAGGTSVGSVPIPIQTWVRIESSLDTTTGFMTTSWFYDGSLTAQDSVADTDTPNYGFIQQYRQGKLLNTSNNPYRFDDLAWRTNTTVFIGPEGGVVTADLSTTWDVVATVTGAVVTAWDVRVPVTDAQTTSWSVSEALSKSQATTWNIFVPIAAPKTISSAWNVYNAVSDSQGTSWDVKAKVTDTQPTEWNVFGKVVDSESTIWSVRTVVPVSQAWDVWNVYGEMVPATVYTEWDIRELITDEITTLWRIGGALRIFRAKGNLGGATSTASSGGNTGNGTMEGQTLASAVLSDSAMEAALGGTTASRTLNPYEFTE